MNLPMISALDLTGYPVDYRALSDMTPFTYRAGMTYEGLLESIRAWIPNTLIPYLNGNFSGLQDSWIDNAASVETQLEAALEAIGTAQVPISDPVIVAAFTAQNSLTRAALDAQYGSATVAPLPLGNGQDDTANLNNALKSPGRVIIRPGTYTVTGTIYVYATARTHVSGYGAILDYAAGSSAVVRVSNAAHVVEGLTLVGNGSTDGSCGFLNNAAGVVIRNNTIQNMGRFGISTQSADNVTIIDNVLDKTSQSTAMSDAPSVAAIINDNGNRVTVARNICTNTRWGITMRSDSSTQSIFGCTVEGNHISCDPAIAAVDPSCQGLSAGWTETLKTIGNSVFGYSSNGMDHHGSHNDVITGNTISRCTGDGIFVGDYDGTPAGTFGTTPSRVTQSTTITGNTITGTSTGVRVYDGAQYVTVSGNTIENFTSTGIVARGGPTVDTGQVVINNITVTGNMINSLNNATGPGIWVTGCTVALIGQNQINRPGTYGVLVDGSSDMVRIENNAIQGAGYKSTAGKMDGVWTNCSRTFIRGNTFYGGNGVAVNVAGGTNSTVTGNRFRSVVGGPITDTGTTTTQSDNLTV